MENVTPPSSFHITSSEPLQLFNAEELFWSFFYSNALCFGGVFGLGWLASLFLPLLYDWCVAWTSSASQTPQSATQTALRVPRHMAVVMDGNRRFGKKKYGIPTKGHHDGSQTLVAFLDYCISAGVQILTIYAFSTENWTRPKHEVDTLMNIFSDFFHRIIPEALAKQIRIRVLITDREKLPDHVLTTISQIEQQTAHCQKFNLNVCVSYGARNEIINACKTIAHQVQTKQLTNLDEIDHKLFSQALLTKDLPDPDLLLRTSGEYRISNFLLYQIAYSELIFLDKMWPEINQDDFQQILQIYTKRNRRYGK